MSVFRREGSSGFIPVSQCLSQGWAASNVPWTTSCFNLVSCSSVLCMYPPGPLSDWPSVLWCTISNLPWHNQVTLLSVLFSLQEFEVIKELWFHFKCMLYGKQIVSCIGSSNSCFQERHRTCSVVLKINVKKKKKIAVGPTRGLSE